MGTSKHAKASAAELDKLPVGLDRDNFMTQLIRHLSGTLQDVVGLHEAEGFISVVGGRLGDDINAEYRRTMSAERLDPPHTAQVLVDIKRRIGGNFRVVDVSETAITLENTRCPFGDAVEGRTSLCMMTSNVFGRITADNLGYARVELDKTIAKGDGHCRVIVHLRPMDDLQQTTAREYFGQPGNR